MENINQGKEIIFAFLYSISRAFTNALPSILGTILLAIFGWIVAKSLAFIAKRIMVTIKIDKISERPPFDEYLNKANLKLKPSEIICKIIYWVVLLIFVVVIAEFLGLQMVSQEISNFVGYLPKLFSAILIFLIGLYLITFIRNFLKAATASLGLSVGKIISGVVFYLLLVILSLTALQQAGIDTNIITSNLSLFIGAVLLSASISYGFASKDILSNILASFFCRKIFEEGQVIEIGEVKGEIIEITNISFRVKTGDGEIIIPNKNMVSTQVKIKSSLAKA